MPFFNPKTKQEEDSPKIDAFLADIFKVYEKHGLSIAYDDDDGSGTFIIETNCKLNRDWLRDANIGIE